MDQFNLGRTVPMTPHLSANLRSLVGSSKDVQGASLIEDDADYLQHVLDIPICWDSYSRIRPVVRRIGVTGNYKQVLDHLSHPPERDTSGIPDRLQPGSRGYSAGGSCQGYQLRQKQPEAGHKFSFFRRQRQSLRGRGHKKPAGKSYLQSRNNLRPLHQQSQGECGVTSTKTGTRSCLPWGRSWDRAAT